MGDMRFPVVPTGPPQPSGLYQPLVFSLPKGSERYVVEGSGAVLISVEQGDRITVSNGEGSQVCEIVAADNKGGIDAGIIGAVANSDAGGLKALLSGSDYSLLGLRMGVQARGMDLSQGGTLQFFDWATPAKTEQMFTAQRDGVVIIATPGGIMDFEKQDTATPLTVMIKRAVIKQVARFELPDPLVDPVLDLRVKSASAEAYFVKAGDYIQIQDVDGANAPISSVSVRANWITGSNMRWM